VLHDAKTTYVVLARPRAGRWTIGAAPGSTIASIRKSAALPVPSVKARLGGRGKVRTLRWRIRNIPGQRVRFTDEGRGSPVAVVTTLRLRGSVRFRPRLGGGRRTIVAWIERNGVPRKRFVVARYTAPAQPRLRKPKQLRAIRRSGAVRVTWKRVPGATKYMVRAVVGDGRTFVLLLSRPLAQLPAVPAAQHVRLAVRAVDSANRRGPAASFRLR
jgi:hypothetical protein